jgi:hypothetical protein
MTNLYPLVWLLILLAALMFLQRRLHFEIQAIFLLLTHRAEIALALFSLLFFPGVFLHETSHYLVARLLGVRTGHFSLLPEPLPDGRLRLGYVETASTDLLRDALIGIAPLLAGGAFVVYAGQYQLDLPALWESALGGEPGGWMAGLSNLYQLPDFWLWFYLVFAVSSTMLPSASDRRAWLPVALFAVLVAGVALFAGAGPWMIGVWGRLSPWFNQALRGLTLIFGISAAVHLALLPPLWLLRGSLARLTGLSVARIGT